MNIFRTIVTEFWGLFVDDGALALALVVWGVAAGFTLPLLGAGEWRAPVLFGGFVGILIFNVLLTAHGRGVLKKD